MHINKLFNYTIHISIETEYIPKTVAFSQCTKWVYSFHSAVRFRKLYRPVTNSRKEETDRTWQRFSRLSRGKSIIQLQDLFTLEQNDKETRGHMLNLIKMDCGKYFFFNRVVIMRNQQIVGAATSLNAFKNRLDKLRKAKMGFFMDWSARHRPLWLGCPAGKAIQSDLHQLGLIMGPLKAVRTPPGLLEIWIHARPSRYHQQP